MEGDCSMTPSRRIWGYFYPRPHMEGDFAEIVFLPTLGISTHALTWRATVDAPHPPFKQLHFYPRPHMEGDHRRGWATVDLRHFYPRPHMEGDDHHQEENRENRISTHALTWRATYPFGHGCKASLISTHALTWRATYPRYRSRRQYNISTHALTWRATV